MKNSSTNISTTNGQRLLSKKRRPLNSYAPTSSIPYPASFNLFDLEKSMGFVVSVAKPYDVWYFGKSVTNVGDINGDTIDDFASGGSIENGNAIVCIIFGSKNIGNLSLDLNNISRTTGFVFDAGVTSNGVVFVSNAGDINADGLNDLLVGLPFDNSPYDFGRTYVIFGNTSIGMIGTLHFSNLTGQNGFLINGTFHSRSGDSLSYAGDINDDGIDDIIIGTEEANAYVVFGKKNVGSDGVIQLTDLNGTNGFVLEGYDVGSVGYAGDINDDGIADLLVSNLESLLYDNAFVYVIFGKKGLGANGAIILSTLNGTNGFIIKGIHDPFANPNYYGHIEVSDAGDINNDGIDDFMMSNIFPDNFTGCTYVIFGRKNIGSDGVFQVSSLNGTNGFKLNGVNPGGNSGYSISKAGDINNDGIDDLIIGAPVGFEFNFTGVTYVIFGNHSVGSNGTISLSSLNGSNGFALNGGQWSEAGVSVSNAGDINDDGIDDLLIGAPGVRVTPYNDGVVYVIFGGRSLYPSPTPAPTPNPTPSPTPNPTPAPTPNPTPSPSPSPTPMPDVQTDNSNSIFIIGASAGGVGALFLLFFLCCCLYKRFHRPNQENIQKPESRSDRPLTMVDSEIVPDSLIPYQSLDEHSDFLPVVSMQNFASADDDSKDSKKTTSTSPKKSWETAVSYEIPIAELQYDEKQEIGHGAYGTVYKGSYKNSDVAVKKLINRPGKDGLDELEKEFKVLSRVRSPYIVQLMGVCLQPATCLLVMELMPKGSLYQFLLQSPQLSLEFIYRIALRVTYGLSHLHQVGIIHRDLKSLNILLGLNFDPKISDFGQSKIKSQSASTYTTGRVHGTLGWVAPEQFDEKQKITEKSDIYSLGMIFWELVIHPYKTPFFGLGQAALIGAKLNRPRDQQETIPKSCPAQFAQLIRSCWQSPKKRPTADNLAKSLQQLWQTEKTKEEKDKLQKSNSINSLVPSYVSNLDS